MEPGPEPEITPTTESGPEESAPAPLAFRDCGQVYRCAELEVPADHANPDAGTVTLELGLLPGSNSDSRIGVLLVHRGGPGGDMNDFLGIGAHLTSRVLARFDVVAWNQRGVMGSVPHDCREEAEQLSLLDPTPDTPEERAAADDAFRETADACVGSLGENASLIGTTQTVNDMDLIRQALGEEQISYLGFSYGSLLGLHYADRYGSHLRAVVVDGVVDPALSNEEFLVGQKEGFGRVIDDLLDDCRQDPDCPIPGDPAEAVEELAMRVAKEPLLDVQGNVLVGPGEVRLALLSATYDFDAWPVFYLGVARAFEGHGLMLSTLATRFLERVDRGSFLSIRCADVGRMSQPEVERLNQRLNETSSEISWIWGTFADLCQYWPDTDPLPVGPIRAPEASSVLVVGNRGDNATPYEWAVSAAAALENGVLLTYNGQEHTSYRRHPCVTQVVDDYLIDLVLPSSDIECG
ncbi:MAG: alpha/beta hydrolase [bacterium]|nr:alpha/beta hydrolase [bacterium]